MAALIPPIPPPKPATPPATRKALAQVRDRAREAMAVLTESDRLVQRAVDEAAAAIEVALDEVVATELARIPVDRLREVAAERGLRLGALEEAGYRTVADVLVAGPAGLDRVEGVGPATAAAAHEAAQQLAVGLRSQVRALPDPDAPLPSSPALLRSLHRVAAELAARPGLVEPAAALQARLAAPAATLDAGVGPVRWLFSGRRRKDEARAAAVTVRADLDDPDTQHLLDGLRRAAAASPTWQPPADAELWADYQRRGADYVTAFERVGAGGVARLPTERLRGGVAGEIAARVEQVALDLRGLKATLRGYQHFGVQYLVGQGRSILGDEMGLGKTIQALAAMCHLRAAEGATHFLVVAPASILANWVREIGERTDLTPLLLHGDDRDDACARWSAEGGVGVTSYTTLPVLPIPPGVVPALVVVDEAHYVKNPEAARTKAVGTVLDPAGRAVLMSGTPMENRVDEFRSLVDLLQPPVPVTLDPAQLVVVEGNPDAFREVLSPVYLRRNQEDVLVELPERIDMDEWVALSAAEAGAYRDAVASGDLMAMRQAATLAPAGATEPSAKFERLGELLEEYEIEDRKVIVFSFFRRVLDQVSALADGCPQITGDLAPDQRLALIDAFTAGPGHAVLAAQIEAGGVGLNLQAASVVVLMEPQFKPSVEHQAIARAHRMGQTRRVVVHRLLARDTVDEWLVELMRTKQDLFDAYARPSAVKEATIAATDLATGAPTVAGSGSTAGAGGVGEVALGAQAIAAEQARLGVAS